MKTTNSHQLTATAITDKFEHNRLQALEAYRVVTDNAEESLDDICTLAAAISGKPRALISFIGQDEIFVKSSVNLNFKNYPRALAFCSQISAATTVLIVQDARLDDRLKNLPLVTGDGAVIFYAGIPLVNFQGFLLGTISVLDSEPGQLSETQITSLQILGRQVMRLLEKRRKFYLLQDTNTALERTLKNAYSEQTELSESEKRMYELISHAPVGISMLIGQNLVIETANDCMLRIWGKKDIIIGMPLSEASPELIEQGYADILHKVFTTGETYHGHEEEVILVHDGLEKTCFFNFMYKAVKNDDDIIYAILTIAQDVTDLKHSRTALEQSQSNLQLALEAGKIGVFELNMSAGTLINSPQMMANFGLGPDTVFNLPELLDAISPNYRNLLKTDLQNAIDQSITLNSEYEVIWPNAEKHLLCFTGQIQKGNQQRFVGTTMLK